MTVRESVKLTREILDKYGLQNWRVHLDNAKTRMGYCSYHHKLISLSQFLIPFTKDEEIIDTITHEIAHALCPGQNHNWKWRQKHIEMGGSGRRNYNENKVFNVPLSEVKKKSPWIATCAKGHVHYKERKPTRGRKYSCSECCKGYYNPNFPIVYERNWGR